MTDKVKFRAFPTAFKLAAIKRLEAGEAVLPLARKLVFRAIFTRALASSPLLPFAAGSASGRNLRGPGLGPRLRFNPAGPCSFHALRQSCRSLRETPSLRAKGSTASPASSRLIAASLKAVGKALNLTLSVIGHPPG